jgi:hypothetical protein
VIDQSDRVQMQLEGDVLTFSASAHGGETLSLADSVSGIRHALGQRYLTAIKLESAIARVEDLIMPMIRSLPAAAQLEIHGAELENIHHLLATEKDVAVAIDLVELLFNQLADYANRVPAAWHQPVPAEQLALGLVVLREVMHHGGYSVVYLPRQA